MTMVLRRGDAARRGFHGRLMLLRRAHIALMSLAGAVSPVSHASSR
jgi:hypothetical protein